MLLRNIQRSIGYLNRQLLYRIQRGTGLGIDKSFEEELLQRTTRFLADGREKKERHVPTYPIESVNFSDPTRFRLVRGDVYRRFVALDGGTEFDEFGRKGRWIPRGSRVLHDRVEDTHVKVFDKYFCTRGEGRFLPDALERGVYDFLCPALAYLLEDDEGDLRGYAIHSGQVLTPYQFERYVGTGLKDAVCQITRRSGLYFYDLIYHNVIRRDNELSFIDLESVLPISWYGKDDDFSRHMLHEIDIGFSIQRKFLSPDWYASYIEGLLGQ